MMKTQTHITSQLRNIAIASMIIPVMIGCSTINKWCGFKDNNIIEESSEKVIEMTTGVDVDLTPETPEG